MDLVTVKGKAYAKPQHLGRRRIFHIFIQDGLLCYTWGIVLLLGTTKEKLFLPERFFMFAAYIEEDVFLRKICLKPQN